MNSKDLRKELDTEFQDFMNSESSLPPRELSERILERVRADLNPNSWSVFGKLSLIHLIVGGLTLALCPQFGVRSWGEGMGLMHVFNALGTYGCMAACGAFFTGTSVFFAVLLLRPEEIRVLRRAKILQIGALTLLSLGAFVMADAEILLAFAAVWILGSLIGGASLLELGWVLRKKVAFG
jgi:hypothetical protein